MIKVVTSVTTWNDAVGTRMSITYSEIDETTGKIISDNKRTDRIITSAETKQAINGLFAVAQGFIDNAE